MNQVSFSKILDNIWTSSFKLSDEESERKKMMVTLVVAIDEELLRRVEASEAMSTEQE